MIMRLSYWHGPGVREADASCLSSQMQRTAPGITSVEIVVHGHYKSIMEGCFVPFTAQGILTLVWDGSKSYAKRQADASVCTDVYDAHMPDILCTSDTVSRHP